jgi:hypothetical protein
LSSTALWTMRASTWPLAKPMSWEKSMERFA